MVTLFDVVIFASEVFHAVVDYGGACGVNFNFTNIIPVQVAYIIDERGFLGSRFNILALRRPAIIESDCVLILACRNK